MISAAENTPQLTPTQSESTTEADTTTAPTSSSETKDTVSPQITQELVSSSARKPGNGFTPARLERIIAALTKLIEAFAALSRARREQQQAQPTLEVPKEPAPQPSQETAQPPDPSAPVVSALSAQPPSPSAQDTQPEIPQQPSSAITTPAESPATTSPSTTKTPVKNVPQKPTASACPREPVKQGRPLSNSSGFLWKPQSDKDGKLAILLPPHLTGKVADVAILSPDGMRTLQRGHYSGSGNGEREHFRFSKPGGDFPDGSIVVIMLKDGSRQHLTIKETSARVQK